MKCHSSTKSDILSWVPLEENECLAKMGPSHHIADTLGRKSKQEGKWDQRERAASMRPHRRDNSGTHTPFTTAPSDLRNLAAKGPPEASKLISLFDRKPGSLQAKSVDHVTSRATSRNPWGPHLPRALLGYLCALLLFHDDPGQEDHPDGHGGLDCKEKQGALRWPP